MLVVVAGMKRSGTTWMYNVARIAMRDVNPQLIGDQFHQWDRNRVAILKIHWWREDIAAASNVVLSSHRNVECVYWSLKRFLEREPTGQEMAKTVEHWRRWDQVADFRMDYNRFLSHPLEQVEAVVDTIGVEVDPAEVLAEVDSLKPPTDRHQDPLTLYFRNHRA